jgi:hypothetical protein
MNFRTAAWDGGLDARLGDAFTAQSEDCSGAVACPIAAIGQKMITKITHACGLRISESHRWPPRLDQ